MEQEFWRYHTNIDRWPQRNFYYVGWQNEKVRKFLTSLNNEPALTQWNCNRDISNVWNLKSKEKKKVNCKREEERLHWQHAGCFVRIPNMIQWGAGTHIVGPKRRILCKRQMNTAGWSAYWILYSWTHMFQGVSTMSNFLRIGQPEWRLAWCTHHVCIYMYVYNHWGYERYLNMQTNFHNID